MINEALFPVAMVALNLPALAVAGLTLFKLTHSRIRSLFLLTLFTGIVWLNAMLCFWSIHLRAEWALPVAKLIFIAGILLLPAFAGFIRALSGRSERDYTLYAFYASSLIALGLILGGLVVSGVEVNETGVSRLNYGPLRLYFVVHFILFGAYIFFRLWKLSRKTEDAIIRYQLGEVFTAGWITFALIALTNTIVPIFAGKTTAVLLGPVFPVIFLARVYALLTQGSRYFLTKQFEMLIASNSNSTLEKNLLSWSEFLAFLGRSFESGAPEMNRRLAFSGASGAFDLLVSKRENAPAPDVMPAAQVLGKQFSAGIIDQSIALDRDNKRLFFALLRAQDLLKQKLLPELENHFENRRLPAGEILTMERIAQTLTENRAEMEAMTGVGFYCFSKNFAEAVNHTMNFARAGEPMLFYGDKSTGRALLARVAAKTAGGGQIAELFPEHEEIFPTEIARLLATEGDLSVIVHNLSVLRPDQIELVEKLMHSQRRKVSLYITASRDFYGSGLDLPDNLTRALSFAVPVPALRDREADVFHLALGFIAEHRNLYPEVPFTAVHADYLKAKLAEAEHIHIADIRTQVLQLCLAAAPPVLAASGEKGREVKALAAGSFSALEESERTVIRTFLLKNKLNKRRTAMELDITINTLVAKIARYKLSYLFGK